MLSGLLETLPNQAELPPSLYRRNPYKLTVMIGKHLGS